MTPQLLNAADTSGVVQAAIKNLATGTVFYFSFPIALDTLFGAGAAMDVTALVSAWKSMDDSLEVSAVVNGELVCRSS